MNRPSETPYKVTCYWEGGLPVLFCEIEGYHDADQRKEVVRQVMIAVKNAMEAPHENVRGVVVDFRKAVYKGTFLAMIERIEMLEELGISRTVRVAVLLNPPIPKHVNFLELYARNRGWLVRATVYRSRAVEWVLGGHDTWLGVHPDK